MNQSRYIIAISLDMKIKRRYIPFPSDNVQVYEPEKERVVH